MTRTFETGAYRDGNDGKPDYEGYLSSRVLRRFGKYMLKNQRQSNGELRGSDNWQLGMPVEQYMKSLWRHVVDAWSIHREGTASEDALEDALCAVIFNAQGMLHELLVERESWELAAPIFKPADDTRDFTDVPLFTEDELDRIEEIATDVVKLNDELFDGKQLGQIRREIALAFTAHNNIQHGLFPQGRFA